MITRIPLLFFVVLIGAVGCYNHKNGTDTDTESDSIGLNTDLETEHTDVETEHIDDSNGNGITTDSAEIDSHDLVSTDDSELTEKETDTGSGVSAAATDSADFDFDAGEQDDGGAIIKDTETNEDDTATSESVEGAPKIVFPPFERAIVGEMYLYKIMVDGGRPSISFNGVLPDGLSFDGIDFISGIPMEYGVFSNLSIVATNEIGKTETVFALTVFPEPTIDDAILADGSVSGKSDGLTWETAFTSIQAAVDSAAEQNLCCVFAAGFFSTKEKGPVLTMADGIFVFGGFQGYADGNGAMEQLLMERDYTRETMLSGGDFSLRTVVGADQATLDGITVTRTGMYSEGGTMRISGCTFINNTGCEVLMDPETGWVFERPEDEWEVHDGYLPCDDYAHGGALSILNANVIVDNANFTKNAAIQGAAIYNENSRVFVIDTTMNDHSEPRWGYGAGLYNLNSIAVVENSTIEDNGYSDGSGVAIYNKSSQLRVSNSRIFDNTDAHGGGGVANVAGSSATFVNVEFSENYGEFGSAAIENYESEALIQGCRFVGNKSCCSVAINNTESSVMHIENSLFLKNYSKYDSNINISNEGILTVENSVFVDNYGSIVNTGGTVSLRNNAFYMDRGSALKNMDGEMSLINVTLLNNGIEVSNGAMENEGESSVQVVNSIFWGNGDDNAGVKNSDESNVSYAFCDVQHSGGSDNFDASFGIDVGENIDELPGFADVPTWIGMGEGTDIHNVVNVEDVAKQIEIDDILVINDTEMYLVTDIDGTAIRILPQFRSDANENITVAVWKNLDFLKLKNDSPCIDRGDNKVVATDFDLFGNLRIFDETVDLGAVEYQKN